MKFIIPRSLHTVARLVCLAVLTVAPRPALADEVAKDPALTSVLQMLGADLSEAVILDWLNTVEDRPRTPSADDLIDLRKAGASDRLMHRLMELSRIGASSTVPARPGMDAPLPPQAPSAPESKTVAPVGAMRGGEALGAVDTRFSLSYSPYVLEGEDAWQLMVYLDGEPLSVVPEGSLINRNALRFSKLIPQGEHRLQILQERHDVSRKAKEHRARVAPEPIDLTLVEARRAEIEIAFKQNLLDQKDPVHYQVRINGRLAGEGEMGGRLEDWRELCEDREKSSKRHRGSSECITWNELWTGEVPSRGQVLEALALFDYRPVPRDQSLH